MGSDDAEAARDGRELAEQVRQLRAALGPTVAGGDEARVGAG